MTRYSKSDRAQAKSSAAIGDQSLARTYEGVEVLVTGGASFIGSHLVDRLVEFGAVVRVADDLSSGTVANLSQSMERIDFQPGDLLDRDFTRAVVAGQKVVFHLAAAHGGRGFIDTHPAECASNMVLDGTVIDEAWRAGVEHVCYASSACVYPVTLQGRDDAPQLREEWADPFTAGAALADGEYGWAKLMGELTLGAYHKQHGLESVACRLFTAFGERENETHAVIALIAKAFVRMDPYGIWGDGQQDRNFTYVRDIVEGMLRAAAHVHDASPVNIGTAARVKIVDLAEMIFSIVGWRPSTLAFDPSKPVGVYSRAADLARAHELLDWEPNTPLVDALERTIRWYEAEHDPTDVLAGLEQRLHER